MRVDERKEVTIVERRTMTKSVRMSAEASSAFFGEITFHWDSNELTTAESLAAAGGRKSSWLADAEQKRIGSQMHRFRAHVTLPHSDVLAIS